MKRWIHRHGARVAATGFILFLASLYGCGGSAGVPNGTIIGRVFSDASSASFSQTPLAGVAVVVRRQDADPLDIIRRVFTDANGQFVFDDMPTGQYLIGFSRQGFIPIDRELTATTTGTNFVREDIFVEPGSTSVVPDITMRTNRQTGSGVAVITVLDGFTGDPVTHATVTAGVAVTSNGGTNGVYSLLVPLEPNDTTVTLTPFGDTPRRLSVQAEGYEVLESQLIGLVANETVERTIFLNPLRVSFEGVIRLDSFLKITELITIRDRVDIQVQNSTVGTLAPRSNSTPGVTIVGPNDNGVFVIDGVPSSNSNLTRSFNIRFTHPNLNTVVLSNVVAPRAGGRSIPMVVTMSFITVDVTGTLVVSNGIFPTTGQVVVEETGQAAAIVNGAFTIPGVPVQQADGDLGMTFRLCGLFPDPVTGLAIPAGATVTVRPVSDGTPNPLFSLGLLVGSPGNCPN